MKNRDTNKKHQHQFMLGLTAFTVTAVLALLFFNNEDRIIVDSVRQLKGYYDGMKAVLNVFHEKMGTCNVIVNIGGEVSNTD